MKKQIEELIAKYSIGKKELMEQLQSLRKGDMQALTTNGMLYSYSEILTDLRTLLEAEQPKKRYFLVYYRLNDEYKCLTYITKNGEFISKKEARKDLNRIDFIITGIQELSEQDFLDWTA
jgi:hypothetical protein